MSLNCTIRELHDMVDLAKTVDLQRVVWRMKGHECTSPHTMKAAAHTGGCVLGAEVDGRMIGFCFGMVAKRGREIWLWSHMTAVIPELQGQGIGYKLKQAQRQWALAHDFRVMAWTFDPMQAGNANFNFNRLGVTAHNYEVNHYGEMQDGLNAGLASDRLEAHWQLDASHVFERAQGAYAGEVGWGAADAKLVYRDESGELCRVQAGSYGDERYGIEIPANIAALKRTDLEYAQRWQVHVREAMIALLEAGYHVSGLVRAGESCWYVMRREEASSVAKEL